MGGTAGMPYIGRIAGMPYIGGIAGMPYIIPGMPYCGYIHGMAQMPGAAPAILMSRIAAAIETVFAKPFII